MSKYNTCRFCLGSGCIHCGNRGQVRARVFTRPPRDAKAQACWDWLKSAATGKPAFNHAPKGH